MSSAMQRSYSIAKPEAVIVPASQTGAVVSTKHYVRSPENIIVDVFYKNLSLTNSVSFKLEDSPGVVDGEPVWVGKTSVATAAATATAHEQLLTFDTFANTTDIEYVVLIDKDGLQWAIAADKTGSSVAPSGAVWTAIPAGRKAQVDISGDTTAANVADAFVTAFNLLTGFTGQFSLTDNTDGTVTIEAVAAGPTLGTPLSLLEDDSGAGSVVVNASLTPPVNSGRATIRLCVGTTAQAAELPLRPMIRVVCDTGAGDSVEIENILVSN